MAFLRHQKKYQKKNFINIFKRILRINKLKFKTIFISILDYPRKKKLPILILQVMILNTCY